MRASRRHLCIACAAAVLLSCVSKPVTEVPPAAGETPAPVVAEEQKPSPAQSPAAQPEAAVEPPSSAPAAQPEAAVEPPLSAPAAQPEATAETGPSAEVVEAIGAAPEPEEATKPQTSGSDFVVTAELYDKTFAEVEALVMKLNEIIKQKNFDEWLAYLTTEYIARTSSPEFLREASQSPILKKDKITLKSLKDYFLYVVVPSRIQAQLDDLKFLDTNHVKAMAIIGGNPVVLYLLVKVDDHWMIGNW